MSRALAGVVVGFASLVQAQILQLNTDSITTRRMPAATGVQGVWPIVGHRGVNLDGTLREPPNFDWAIAGNPFGEPWNDNIRRGAVRLDLGTWTASETDLELPAPAFTWPIGRSYNARQYGASGYQDSNGYQGYNWTQNSQPELSFYDTDSNSSTKEATDLLFLVAGADRFFEYKRKGTTGDDADIFIGVNGAGGAMRWVTDGSGPDLILFYDQTGLEVSFFAFNDSSHIATAKQGQLWRMVRRGTNASSDSDDYFAYVGDKTDKSTALSGYDSSGRMLTAYDTAGRKYEYSYTSGRLTSVIVKVWSGSAWVATGDKVEYAYYGSSESHGLEGDLKLATTTRQTSDSTRKVVAKTYYRYYTTTWTNADGQRVHPHCLKMVVGPNGTRAYDFGEGGTETPAVLDDGFLTAADSVLKPYADAWFEAYDQADRRITKAFFAGECTCSGGGLVNGLTEFAYENNGGFSNTSGYDTVWHNRTVVTLPPHEYALDSYAQPMTYQALLVQYFDETGQCLSRVTAESSLSATPYWPKLVVRDSSGRIEWIHWPANITSYTHSSASFATSTSAGLVRKFIRETSGTYTGFLRSITYQSGYNASSQPTSYYELTKEYLSAPSLTPSTGFTIVRPLLQYEWAYTEASSTAASHGGSSVSGAYETQHAYTMWTGDAALSLKRVTTTHPAVATTKNGSGSAATHDTYSRTDGTAAFEKADDGAYTYTSYSGGLLVKRVDDADISHSSEFGTEDPYGTFGINESGAYGLHVVTTYAYVGDGLLDTTVMYAGSADAVTQRTFHTVLDDGRPVELFSPKINTTPNPDVYYGPVSYRVRNLSGNLEADATVSLSSGSTTTDPSSWINTSTSTPIGDPIAAFSSSVGSLLRYKTTVFDKPGLRKTEDRVYHTVPSSGAGAWQTNYDQTLYKYDDAGNRVRTVDPSGTILRVMHEGRGLPLMAQMGTDDSTIIGLGPTNNMRWIWASSYNGGQHPTSNSGIGFPGNLGGSGEGTGDGEKTGGACCGDVDETDLYLYCWDDESDSPGAFTSVWRDVRGFPIVVHAPSAPHMLYIRDNLGRPTVVGLYSSTTGLDMSDNPTTLTTNRVGLVEIFYDERGRVWKRVVHKINPADGSDTSGAEITELSWYDDEGRLIKRSGPQLFKVQYDGLGRETNRYILAKANDTTYSGLYTASSRTTLVTNDIVLEEHQSNRNLKTGDVLLSVVIRRHHNDYGSSETTGALDTNADADRLKVTAANLKGRAQITASWFDDLRRETTRSNYGTNAGSDFDRTGLSAPTSSTSGRLVTAWSYDSAGALYEFTDARGSKTRYEYDHAGRQTVVTENYTNGTPGGGSDNDEDRVTRYTYSYPPSEAPGLIRTIVADRDGTDDDQTTTYTYGTVNTGTGDMISQIATGHLLSKIKYPDSSGSSDVVELAYNLGRVVTKVRDQAGNITEITYDGRRREKSRTVSTLASGFDGAVRSIHTTYTGLGQIDTVTQKDGSSTPVVTDQVKFSWDGWGQLTQFDQDWDSTVGGSGGISTRSVTYAYERSTAGRTTVRRTSATYPTGNDVVYKYLSSGGRHDDEASRVTRVTLYNPATDSELDILAYEYLGAERVVGTDYLEPNTWNHLYGTSSGSYPDLDQFDRVTTDKWTRTTGYSGLPTVNPYEAAVTYDSNSNPTLSDDKVHATTFDAKFDVDNLNRLQRAQEGEWGGSSFTTTSRDERWDLGPTGNWTVHKLDLNGDGDFVDTNELDENNPDTGSTPNFNKANEQTGRNTNNSGGNEHTLVYDAVGNMTNDGKDYKYVYDAFGRLRKVLNRSNDALVAEYRYNGLGYRIAWHYDTTDGSTGEPDGDVDSDDPWYYFLYDEHWRVIATVRGNGAGTSADSSAKERFIHHAAGYDGDGGGSYIDAIALRDRDGTNGWAGAADGTLEQRHYLFQNWRHDVVMVLKPNAEQVEQTRYSAYGVPFGLPAADANSNGMVDAADLTLIYNMYSGTYGVLGDINLNGMIDVNDLTLAYNLSAAGHTLGRGVLSRSDVGLRRGYAGYEWDPAVSRYHVRNRVYAPELGRWLARDPIEYVVVASLYHYADQRPMFWVDPLGLLGEPTTPPSTTRPPGIPRPPGVMDPGYTIEPGDSPQDIVKKQQGVIRDRNRGKHLNTKEMDCCFSIADGMQDATDGSFKTDYDGALRELKDQTKSQMIGYAAVGGAMVAAGCCELGAAARGAGGAADDLGGGIAKTPGKGPPGRPKPPWGPRTFPESPSVKPPGYDPKWEVTPIPNSTPRYTDPATGNNWRCHLPDAGHKNWHWDFQPGKDRPWINLDPSDLRPLPGQEDKVKMIPKSWPVPWSILTEPDLPWTCAGERLFARSPAGGHLAQCS